MNKSNKTMLTVLGYFTALFAVFIMSGSALAADGGGIGDVAKTVTGSIKNIASLISAAAYVAGIGFALSGMMKFKAHKDNPQQTPLSQPITLIAVAAGLVFLPSIIKAAGGTLFSGGGETGGATGEGLEIE